MTDFKGLLMDERKVQSQIVEMSRGSREAIAKAEGNTLEDAVPTLDYAGSAEKTDPEEIRLVKKLDRWILVSLSIIQSLLRISHRLTRHSLYCGCSTFSTSCNGNRSVSQFSVG